MSNFTKNGIYESLQAVACTSSLHGKHFIYSLAALKVLLAITATLGNTLILAALRMESSLYPPSKLMFQCLAVTDLCVGVLAQPLFVIQLMSLTHKRVQLCHTVESINKITGATLGGVSLLTLTAISVDRLLALLLGLRYRQTVTLRRARTMVIIIWILNIATCSLRRFWKPVVISRVISVSIHSSLAISALSYLIIYLKLRRHQNAMQGQENKGGNSLNIARYRKTVSTALCVQLALIACYLPYAIVVAMARHSTALNLAARIAITFVFLNSSLNPILYCWKINSVRQAVNVIIRQLCNCVLGS
ncbi:adenosine receptor A2a-like [Oculina patagonica]